MRLLLVIWILAVSLTATTAAAVAAAVDVDADASTTSSAYNAATMTNVESIIADGEAEEEEPKKKTPPNEMVRHRIGRRRKTPLMDVIETDTNNISNRKEIVRPKKGNFASGTSIFLDIQKDGGSQHDDDDDKKKQKHLSDNRDTIGQVVVVHDDNNNNNNNNNNEYYYTVVGERNDEIKKNQMDLAAANEEEVSTVMMRMMLDESSVSGTLSMDLRLADFSLSMDLDTNDSVKVEPLTLTLPASSTSDADGVVEPALVSYSVPIYLLLKDFVWVYVCMCVKIRTISHAYHLIILLSYVTYMCLFFQSFSLSLSLTHSLLGSC
jgi:hypothetical protein